MRSFPSLFYVRFLSMYCTVCLIPDTGYIQRSFVFWDCFSCCCRVLSVMYQGIVLCPLMRAYFSLPQGEERRSIYIYTCQSDCLCTCAESNNMKMVASSPRVVCIFLVFFLVIPASMTATTLDWMMKNKAKRRVFFPTAASPAGPLTSRGGSDWPSYARPYSLHTAAI